MNVKLTIFIVFSLRQGGKTVLKPHIIAAGYLLQTNSGERECEEKERGFFCVRSGKSLSKHFLFWYDIGRLQHAEDRLHVHSNFWRP